MNTITLNNHQLTYHIRYQKNRKTLQIKIISSTHLEVTAPNRFPKTNIEDIIYKKSSWIMKQLLHRAAINENPINKSIRHGAPLLYQGKSYNLVFTTTESNACTIHLQDNQMIISMPRISPEQITSYVESFLKLWYREMASNILTDRTALWATKINVKPQRITIKEQKTRWGSCSSKGNINYNWRIVMAPPEVIDYLVIHELCHLRVPNHSALFWQEVYTFSPKFKQHRTWLKHNGAILMNILQKS